MVNGLDFKAPVYWFNEIVVKGLDFSVCQFSFLFCPDLGLMSVII
jgi:hypothetical protein